MLIEIGFRCSRGRQNARQWRGAFHFARCGCAKSPDGGAAPAPAGDPMAGRHRPGSTGAAREGPSGPLRGRARALALVSAFGVAAPADALRIVNYNILNYPGSTGPTRDPHFRTILAPLSPDVVVVQEMQSQAGVDEFLGSVLNTLEPGAWAAAPFLNRDETDNALVYKPAKGSFLGSWGVY